MKRNGHKLRIGKLSEFRPQAVNANKHTERGLRMLDDAMSEDGYVAPATATADKEVIDGSARLERAFDKFDDEAIILEHDGTRPIITVRTDIPNANTKEAKRIAVRANQIAAADLEWDASILAQLKDEGVELSGMFTEKELAALLPQGESKDSEPQVDKAAELQQKWQVATGEIIQIGRHRLMCGDSANKADVNALMMSEKAGLVFTDPPYNVASENDVYAANVSKAMSSLRAAEWDKNFDPVPALRVLDDFLADDATVYVCSSHHLINVIWTWMGEWADHFSWCAWVKPNPMPSLSKRHWTWNGELIAYGTRGKHVFNFPNSGHAPSMWEFTKHKTTEHPTEKTVELVGHAISHSSNAGDVVLDPFVGSGTTLVAAENLNRTCYAMEISPEYCAVVLERMTTAFPSIKIEREAISRAA